MEKNLFYLILVGLLCGCMPQYQLSDRQSFYVTDDQQAREGVVLTTSTDSVISYKRLARRANRRDLQLVMFRIENFTPEEIVINYGKIEAISTNTIELIPLFSPQDFYKKMKNKPYDEILAGLLGGAFMFSYGSAGILFNPYSPSWLLTAAAPFLLIRNGKIDKQLRTELEKYDLQDQRLLPGDFKIGLVALETEKPQGIKLRYRLSPD
jgi:hypothetical protein